MEPQQFEQLKKELWAFSNLTKEEQLLSVHNEIDSMDDNAFTAYLSDSLKINNFLWGAVMVIEGWPPSYEKNRQLLFQQKIKDQ
jgi:hypothetical protein